MQEGATSHTTNLNINFLNPKFWGRITSHQSPLRQNWPPNSPDLNPLDSFVWGYIQDQVFCIKPESIPELQRAVEEVSATILKVTILTDVAKNVRKRLGVSGGIWRSFWAFCQIYQKNDNS